MDQTSALNKTVAPAALASSFSILTSSLKNHARSFRDTIHSAFEEILTTVHKYDIELGSTIQEMTVCNQELAGQAAQLSREIREMQKRHDKLLLRLYLQFGVTMHG
ncbi:hypothetical protein MBLNU457_g0393t1 [Dothideomycetes sp. NU457]